MSGLVLSVFPGIDLLGRGFELEGFCVVRGPDLIWGGDVRDFHPPGGVFDGVIGGPPCQEFIANLSAMVKSQGHESEFGNLIPEFERVVREAQPSWFIMENVRRAPMPSIPGYALRDYLLNNRWFGEEQNRQRRFSWGWRTLVGYEHRNGGVYSLVQTAPNLLFDVALFENPRKAMTVLGADTGPRRRDGRRISPPLAEKIRLQGLPDGFLDGSPLTVSGKHKAIGNGVPIPMARAVAKAVRRSLEGGA